MSYIHTLSLVGNWKGIVLALTDATVLCADLANISAMTTPTMVPPTPTKPMTKTPTTMMSTTTTPPTSTTAAPWFVDYDDSGNSPPRVIRRR